ncbi:hypothetical protein [Cryobacterium sp. TMT1-66-1]|uniref:hypothetical protein n=1 Tax=Cryobacterium sp. TMT1-66-1 TaxID=1259242 RepID=UPI001069AA10|nr:hypothetical protein [Cryobacterium sp. TMT1-66-1]TFD04150.1 hypothetical protein E3T29_15970 [Cryobacterium sp. TMT1-66-1]
MITTTNPLTLTEPIIRELRTAFLDKGRAELTVSFDGLAHNDSGRRWIVDQTVVSLGYGAEDSDPVPVSDLHVGSLTGYRPGHWDESFLSYSSSFKHKLIIRVEDLLLMELRPHGLYICGSDEDDAGDLHISVGETTATHQISDARGSGTLRCSICGPFCVAREDD